MADKFASLRRRIADDSDRLLFDEVIKCTKARAYRAAYIITWVSIAESLRTKFVAMAVRDDAVQQIVKKIGEYEEQERPADKYLVDKAAELGMITADEKQKLQNILRMRGIYAHPTGAGPSREELIAAIQVSVDAVLSRPPLLRHGYVDGLLQSLFTNRHYLDDVPERVQEFATSVAPRIHPDVIPFLVRRLLERLEPTMNDPGMGIFRRRGIEFGTAVLASLHPNLSGENWDVLSLISKYPTAGSVLFGTPEVWASLSEHCRDMVLGNLIEPVEDGKVRSPSSTGLGRARALSSRGLLTERQKERLHKAIEAAPRRIMKAAGVPLLEYSQRIVDELSSHNWYVQNPAADALLDAGADEVLTLDHSTQEQLGRNILQSAEGTATSSESFIETLVRSGEVWPRHFVEGLLLETMVNEEKKFRVKGRQLTNVLLIVTRHPDRNEIFEAVSEEVRASKPRLGKEEYDEGITAVEVARDRVEAGVHPYLDALVAAMKAARGQAEADEDVPF